MIPKILAMHIRFTSFIVLFLIQTLTYCYGQNIKKYKDKINGENISYQVMESVETIKGIVFLLPGFGESLQSIFKKTQLPHLLSRKGFITIVPELHQTLFADAFTNRELSELIRLISEKYKLHDPDVIVGGLSAGGAVALGYAEYCASSDASIRLKGVFAIDPPLDLERIYYSAEKMIQYNCGGVIRKEGYFLKSYLEKALGGRPDSHPEAYI